MNERKNRPLSDRFHIENPTRPARVTGGDGTKSLTIERAPVERLGSASMRDLASSRPVIAAKNARRGRPQFMVGRPVEVRTAEDRDTDLETAIPGRAIRIFDGKTAGRWDVLWPIVLCNSLRRNVIVPATTGMTTYVFDPQRPRDFVMTGSSQLTLDLRFNNRRLEDTMFFMLASGRLTDPDDRYGGTDTCSLSGRIRVFSHHAASDKGSISLKALFLGKSYTFQTSNEETIQIQRTPEIEHEGHSPIQAGSHSYQSVYNQQINGEQTQRNGRVPANVMDAKVIAQRGHSVIVDIIWRVDATIEYRAATNENEQPVDGNGEPWNWEGAPVILSGDAVVATREYDPNDLRREYVDGGAAAPYPTDPECAETMRAPIYTVTLSGDVKAYSNRLALPNYYELFLTDRV